MADCGVQFSEGQWCHRPAEHSGPHQDFLRRGALSGAGSLHPSETFPPERATSPNAIRRALGLAERAPSVRYVGPKPWRAALATYLRLSAERLERRPLFTPANLRPSGCEKCGVDFGLHGTAGHVYKVIV